VSGFWEVARKDARDDWTLVLRAAWLLREELEQLCRFSEWISMALLSSSQAGRLEGARLEVPNRN